MGKVRGLRLLAIAASFGLAGTSSVLADGEFVQFDFAPGASTVVGSVVRGPIGVALGWSEYDSGSAFSANATYSFGLPALGDGALLRVGPSVRLDQDKELDLGAKVVFERWSPTKWGGLFFLADYNTIQNEYLVLGELSHGLSGLNASFAAQGGDNGFRENTLVLGYLIPESCVRLRLGYRFEAQQVLIGFSVNTF